MNLPTGRTFPHICLHKGMWVAVQRASFVNDCDGSIFDQFKDAFLFAADKNKEENRGDLWKSAAANDRVHSELRSAAPRL